MSWLTYRLAKWLHSLFEAISPHWLIAILSEFQPYFSHSRVVRCFCQQKSPNNCHCLSLHGAPERRDAIARSILAYYNLALLPLANVHSLVYTNMNLWINIMSGVGWRDRLVTLALNSQMKNAHFSKYQHCHYTGLRLKGTFLLEIAHCWIVNNF